ncbi:MAG: sulfatase-like hydrolase/transferase [bacterium]|nr:sulfatase-like hydrolase/transferase [bacterium]
MYWKAHGSVKNKILFFTLILLLYFYTVVYFFIDVLTGNGFDQAVVYYLKYGLQGAGFLEYWKMLLISIGILLVGSLSVYFFYTRTKQKGGKKKIYLYIAYSFIVISFILNPMTQDFYKLYSNTFSSPKDLAEFDNYYIYPDLKKIGENKNLVFIYLEGLDQQYFDEGVFPGLTENLSKLQERSTFFTNVKTLTGSDWTTGGIVSGQCGIPLFNPAGWRNVGYKDDFLPSADCLGDLLSREGYYNTYYGGADLFFGGKDKFFIGHGFDEVYGKDEILAKTGKDLVLNPWSIYKTGLRPWGLYDDDLFDFVYNEFLKISENKEKYAMFMITLDTHHPEGHSSPSCDGIKYKSGSNSMLNAVACTDKLVSEFVEKIFNSPDGENVVVAIASDHIGKKNISNKSSAKSNMNNLFMIIESKVHEKIEINKLGSTLDIGATLLPFIGYESSIGLGRDLLNNNNLISDIEKIHNSVPFWKVAVSKFWNFPKVEEYIEIDIDLQQIKIDNKIFEMPVLVRFNENFETIIQFGDKKKFTDFVLSLPKNIPYFFVDKFGDEYYLISGNSGGCTNRMKLENNIRLDMKQIRKIMCIDEEVDFAVKRVAHAGGGLGELTKTNRYEPMNKIVENGFEYIEIDFSFTSDDQLICLHDWENGFERMFGYPSSRVSLKEFENLIENKKEFTICTLDTLIEWLNINKNVKIITDVKDFKLNLEALAIIKDKFSEYKDRIIPQIYFPQNFEQVKKMGYENIIWTLYAFQGSDSDVLGWVEKMDGLAAVAMPEEIVERGLANTLKNKGVPVYVHTINEKEDYEYLIENLGVTEIYTDYLYYSDFDPH